MKNLLSNLSLHRPLAILDIESTGTAVKTDRILELSILKVFPGLHGRQDTLYRCNPGMPIPPEATDVHGICNGVADTWQTFAEQAPQIAETLDNCDLAGFAIRHFDLPMLCHEFRRAKHPFPVTGRKLIDVMEIFKRYHPRTLSDAVLAYLGHRHTTAHSADGDTQATAEVLEAMLRKHDDLPSSVDSLHDRFAPVGGSVDIGGFFVRDEHKEIRFAHGKHKGRPLAEIAQQAPGYLRWMLDQGDFLDDARAIAHQALTRETAIR